MALSIATFAPVSACLWRVGSDITLASVGPTPGGAGPDAMPRKESFGRSDVRVFGIGSRELSGAMTLLKRGRILFWKADMLWAERVMGSTALVVGRESFENEWSRCVESFVGQITQKRIGK